MNSRAHEVARPDALIRSLKVIFTISHVIAFAIVNNAAPEPYIDETFHVAQCQAYCQYRFNEWNEKITTPPGLYLVSFSLFKLGELLHFPFDLCSITALRFLNLFFVCTLLPSITKSLYGHIHADASPDVVELAGLLPALPLLSFFGNLYYTDVLSTTSVLYCYLLAIRRKYGASAIFGGLSTLTRQTNIIWLAFIFAVSVIRDLKEADIVELKEKEESPIPRAQLLFDPLAADARFPADYIIAVHQCVRALVTHFYVMSPSLLSYIPVFGGFVLFLFRNNGIVLGDKSNHVAGLNIPQLLYCGVFIAVFSAPILLSLPTRNILKVAAVMGTLLLIVHFNTIEHPFLRSDNRHFVFYIWRRTINRHFLSRYLAVPVYYASNWLILNVLRCSQSTLFVLGIIGCTALTIVPAPLLEFRYFVLPYLFWRLHLSPALVGKWQGIMEYLWYEAINLITLWIFISKPFTWDSEPGKIQRFIW